MTSEISPEKSDRGPEMTLTDSPIENWALMRGRSAVSWCNSRSTSSWVSGTGSLDAPTNPVTPGVPLTRLHESSLRSMLTSTYPGIVRFSTVIFWLSFISDTDSVGTTIWRTAVCCPSETTRCSRFCLTLFSWPEYVLTTYQRNISIDSGSDGYLSRSASIHPASDRPITPTATQARTEGVRERT